MSRGFNDLSADAIHEHKQTFSYGVLYQAMAALQARLPVGNDKSIKIGVLATRSALAYAAILLSVKTGNTFVPLNPSFPPQQLKSIIDISGIKIVIGNEKHRSLFEHIDDSNNLQVCWVEDFPRLVVEGKDLDFPDEVQRSESDIAYEMFTSGTTGIPKGVPVSYKSLTSYIEILVDLFPVLPTDRCSQLFDLSFDLSIHDIFITLSAGACLVAASNIDLMMPMQYVYKNRISVWFSVPSMANVVRSAQNIKPEQLKTLRLSQFCGEPLTQGLANEWLKLAPQSLLVNLYGPTECTISISYRIWHKASSSDRGQTVPIGQVFPRHKWGLLGDVFYDEESAKRRGECVGELVISGPQVFSGYSKTKIINPFYQSQDGVEYYCTGDLVSYINGELIHKGRLDDQVKIKGFRIELGDVETKLKKYYGSEDIIVVTDRRNNPQGLVAILNESLKEIKFPKALDANLPPYMMPARLIFTTPFFKNASGKIDRRRMAETYLPEYISGIDD